MKTSFPRWMKSVLALTVLAQVGIGAWFYNVQGRHFRRHVENQLEAIAGLKVTEIVNWRDDQIAEGVELMVSRSFSRDVSRWMENPRDGDLSEDIRDKLQGLRDHYDYQDILLLTPDGQVRLSLSGAANTGSIEAQTLTAAVRDRKPVLTDLHTDAEHWAPTISVVTPLFIDSGETRRLLGAVVLVNQARQFLYPLIQSWPTPSETAETLLVRRDGDDVLFLNDVRHVPGAAFILRIPLSRKEVQEVGAVLGTEGVVQGIDYRGVDVISVLRPVPDSPWYTVTKVDMAEAFAEWQFEFVQVFLLLAGWLSVTGAVTFVAWQRNLKTSYQALYESEVALHARDELYKTLVETAMDGVFLVDTNAHFVVVNRTYCLLSGYSESELLGMNIPDVEAAETRPDVAAHIERVIVKGSDVFESKHRRKDGSVYDVEISARYLPIEGGRFVCFIRDVTERKRTEKSLRMMADMLDVAPDSVTVHDFEGKFLYANRRTFEIHGYDKREFMSLNLHDLDVPGSEALIAERMRLIAEKGEATFEVRHFRKDKSTIPLEVSVRTVEWDGMPAVLSIATDITERKRAEEEKEKLRTQLVEAQKMESVGRLAGGVAHDFNNMLAVIIGRVEMALEEAGSDEQLRIDLEEIRKAAQRSTDLTRQLLAFARRQTAAPRVVDLNTVVADALKMLRRLIGEDIDLVWMPAVDLWPVRIDPTQVDQILANLCVNARDAIAGTGKVTIETENVTLNEAYCAKHAEAVSGQYAMLTVSDDGCGMGKDVLKHLFEPFFTTKEAGRGTGLGLATVYGIVKQNGGFINVYSEPGTGTTFKIYLPRIGEAVAESTPEATSEKARGGGETVLVVEDDELILRLGKTMLEGLGYTVLTAGTPGEAIRLGETHAGEIRLLITDVVMPEMNGKELADRLKAIVPGIKSLFMSGYTADVIAHHGVLDEGVQFIQKPFTRNDLARKVREVLD